MCGIVGYIGEKQAAPFLLSGLARLEYRGYDSAGIAVYNNGDITVAKKKGKLAVLSESIEDGFKIKGTFGIGHTRWATHGEPSDVNSHPHTSMSGTFAVVHNGIIENYLTLKDELTNKGFEFKSQTDTEVIAQLLEMYYEGDLFDAVVKTTARLNGSYALGIVCKDYPDTMMAVRKESPLIVGLGTGENYIASDIPAILGHTRNVYLLENDEFVVATKEDVKIYDRNKNLIKKKIFEVNWDVEAAEKGGYDSFMYKEMLEQPRALRDTIHPRIHEGHVKLDNISMTKEDIEKFTKISIIGCGSAYHVGCVGKYVIEKLTRKPVEVELASEFRYREPIVDDTTLVVVISQSGETADTIAAMRDAKKAGARILSIVNVVGSTIARESEDILYTWAGPEIAVATTKAYSTQLSAIYLIALYMADLLGTIEKDQLDKYVKALYDLPDKVEKVIEKREEIKAVADEYCKIEHAFFIGRGTDYAAAMEGSLKLKEISYVHSEAYAAGELKHGTISLIENGTLVVAVAASKNHFDKMLSNIEEVRARGAVIYALCGEGNKLIEKKAKYVFYIPDTEDIFTPSLVVPPMQLFGYYVSKAKGLDVDKPRNLAKSVTVE
ncbi:MAG: glutamine--fructose-6-phosphate transaminase (isomerizing) [Bacillota bacterium]|nr:glutamine--fructose-6-phosphate transaminase (isomerizing) [Bacillota bacterium]